MTELHVGRKAEAIGTFLTHIRKELLEISTEDDLNKLIHVIENLVVSYKWTIKRKNDELEKQKDLLERYQQYLKSKDDVIMNLNKKLVDQEYKVKTEIEKLLKTCQENSSSDSEKTVKYRESIQSHCQTLKKLLLKSDSGSKNSISSLNNNLLSPDVEITVLEKNSTINLEGMVANSTQNSPIILSDSEDENEGGNCSRKRSTSSHISEPSSTGTSSHNIENKRNMKIINSLMKQTETQLQPHFRGIMRSSILEPLPIPTKKRKLAVHYVQPLHFTLNKEQKPGSLQKYTCACCGAIFGNYEPYKRHLSDYHQGDSRLKQCRYPGCQRLYQLEGSRRLHEKSVHKLFYEDE